MSTPAMSDEWRTAFHDVMARHVDSGQMPGLIAWLLAATRFMSK